ncbi:MAG: hypothetical protein EOP09_10660 [Proteobacteria bacterium]|nr:MAG: hypothetical protein EOP09_10660 [Pseudomonadota bacterium]
MLLFRRILIHGFILFQLLVVVVTPNRDSFLGQKVNPFIEPYINFFEFASSWNFFAPDPGPPPLKLEWELLDQSGRTVSDGEFPGKESFFFHDLETRRVAITRFFVYSDERHLGVWGDYLCRQHPEANGFRLWKAVGSIANLFEVQSGNREVSDPGEFTRTAVGTHFCVRGKK